MLRQNLRVVQFVWQVYTTNLYKKSRIHCLQASLHALVLSILRVAFVEVRVEWKKHPTINGTHNYYLKTIGYCFTTKAKGPLILTSFLSYQVILRLRSHESGYN